MPQFYALVFGLSRLAAVVAAAALIFMVGIIALEIVLRTIFSTSTFVTSEFVGYAMMICVIWSLGYVLEHGQLIRVNVLLQHLSPRTQNLLTAIAALVVCAGVSGLAWLYWVRTERAFERGTVSSSIAAVPTWIPEGIMMAGMAIFAVQLLAHALRQLTGHSSPAPHDPDALTE